MTACSIRRRTRAFTLIELLVVIAIIAVLIGLLLPAIQKVKEASKRARCQNNLKQIALGIVQYTDVYNNYPHYTDGKPYNTTAATSSSAYTWMVYILPFIEQQAAYNLLMSLPPYDVGANAFVPLYLCPSDPRGDQYFPGDFRPTANRGGATGYVAIPGYSVVRPVSSTLSQRGPMNPFSVISPVQVSDGLSNTLLLGERPSWTPGTTGVGYYQIATNLPNTYLGTAETQLGETHSGGGTSGTLCSTGTHYFALPDNPDAIDNACIVNQLWSNHPGGANFAFGDGSVHFLTYSIGAPPTGSTTSILMELSTFAGGGGD